MFDHKKKPGIVDISFGKNSLLIGFEVGALFFTSGFHALRMGCLLFM